MAQIKLPKRYDLEQGIDFINSFAVDWSPIRDILPHFHDNTKEKYFEDLESRLKYDGSDVVVITGKYIVKSPESYTPFSVEGKLVKKVQKQ